MKKLIILCILILISGCSPKNDSVENDYKDIPSKNNPLSFDIEVDSVNMTNIDNYLFRDDVFYVDCRPYSWVMRDGYIPGFTFIPFYDYLATRKSDNNAYFKMTKGIEDGKTIDKFIPIYYESKQVLKSLIPTDKKIFIASQSGVESYYLATLLYQNGYEAKNLYNVGGVSHTAYGFSPYCEVGKKFIKGNKGLPVDVDGSLFKIDFSKMLEKEEITLIEK